MNLYSLWRVLEGFIITVVIVIPIWFTWFVISYFDGIWNKVLWQPLLKQDIPFVGFILCLIYFYVVGTISETRAGKWVLKMLNRIPVIGHLLVSFNPRVWEILKKSKGAFIAYFQSGWQYAFLTNIHKTEEGILGSVLYGTAPPTRQMVDHDSRIKVLKIVRSNGIFYEMIPTRIALQHELSSGMTVSEGAYRNLVTITFGEFIRASKLFSEE